MPIKKFIDSISSRYLKTSIRKNQSEYGVIIVYIIENKTVNAFSIPKVQEVHSEVQGGLRRLLLNILNGL